MPRRLLCPGRVCRGAPVVHRRGLPGVTPWNTMKLRADQTGDRGIPMPLWLQGALESAQAAVISALVVLAPIVAVWATAGFQNNNFDVLARLGGQAWLLIHGVPLHLTMVAGEAAASPEPGALSLIPLGLTLIPVPACVARRPAPGPGFLHGPAVAGAAGFVAGLRRVRQRHGLRVPHGRRRHLPVVRRAGAADSVRPGHGGGCPARSRVLEPAHRRRRRGLDCPDQPAFPLGRLLPWLPPSRPASWR